MFKFWLVLFITFQCTMSAYGQQMNTPPTEDYYHEMGFFRRFAHQSLAHTREFGTRFLSTGLTAGNAIASRMSTARKPTTIAPFRRASPKPANFNTPKPISSLTAPSSPSASAVPARAAALPPQPLPPLSPITAANAAANKYRNISLYESTCDCRSAGPPSANSYLQNSLSTATTLAPVMTSISTSNKPTSGRPVAGTSISGEIINTRIVNGTMAEANSYPYLVSLGRAINNQYTNQSHYCGGALLNSRWVLTAAHCISDYKPKKLLIAMGSTDRNRMRLIVETASTVVHPEYSGWPEYANDIALVQLKQDIRFSQHVRPGCLHLQRLRFNGILTGLGWGQIAYSGVYPADLQKVTFNYVRNSDCQNSWSKESAHPPVTKQHICVHNPYSDICGGDSGSPLVYHSDGRDFIVGVASFTNYCDKSQPAVYIRIYPYSNWILSVIRDYCF